MEGFLRYEFGGGGGFYLEGLIHRGAYYYAMPKEVLNS